MAELIALFKCIGLSDAKAAETAKNAALSRHLAALIGEARRCQADDARLAACGALLYNCASRLKSQLVPQLPLLARYIIGGQLDSTARLSAALDYLLLHPEPHCVDTEALERECGVGVHVTAEQVAAAVTAVLADNQQQLTELRYSFPAGQLLEQLRQRLRWADGRQLKQEFDRQLLQLLGPRTELDTAAAAAARKGKGKLSQKSSAAAAKTATTTTAAENGDSAATTAADAAASGGGGAATMCELMKKVAFHRPGENYTTDGYQLTANTMDHMRRHVEQTGGQVRTRFPPEPNGILHIGHAKAININFGYAAAHGGVCLLRYDDTNPEREEEKFFVGIRDMVEWLGYRPHAITHSSDYFDRLYETACQLIAGGHAYVCHQSAEQVRGQNVEMSPWRERPPAESLRLFADMRHGKLDEGAATLRLKVTLEEGKVDPVAYRIKYVPHHRTGSEWCIYPTYDYTHCLCDSFENISHSLCTKEFQSRRSSYYWLCNAADVYCPVQWEYGRLNVTYTVVSKRKIGRLIAERVVADWDDPRLFTLTALRRRGFPPAAINDFCARLGVTGAQMTVEPALLEAVVRERLNVTAPRRMAVLQPLRVRIVDLPAAGATAAATATATDNSAVRLVSVPDFPSAAPAAAAAAGAASSKHHNVQLTSVIYIEQSDYRSSRAASSTPSTPSSGDYRRLTPSQPVGLRHAGLAIHVLREHWAADGSLRELEVSCQPPPTGGATGSKPRAFIHWVSGNPQHCTVRLYEPLFRHRNPEDPGQVPEGFLSDINPNSLTEVEALVDRGMSGAIYEQFQFERLGYFSVDPDSTADRLVFNRTVTLKEDAGKN